MNPRRTMMMAVTVSGTLSRNAQQVEGRSEGKDGEGYWYN